MHGIRSAALGTLSTDVRYAVRLLARSPLFTTTSVLSLAVGIAAATALVGAANGVLSSSPGIREPRGVVHVGRTTNGSGYGTMSYPLFDHLRRHTRTLESMAATTLGPVPFAMRDGELSERVYGRTVSGEFFDVLRVRPAIGRFFRPIEDRTPGAHPVAVLSHRFWVDRFGRDPDVVGRPIRLNDRAFTVIGVAEEGFDGATIVGTNVWVPMAMAGIVRRDPGALTDAGAPWLMAIGRLAPGATPGAAEAELNTLLDGFRAVTPNVPESHGVVVASGGRLPVPVRLPFTAFLGLLFGLTVCLIAVACSNVAGMLLVRATARREEMATRLAVGASRAQLVGQLLVETLVLFAGAGMAALPLAVWVSGVLQQSLPAIPVPIHLDLMPGFSAVAFAMGLSFVAALVFGLAPARHALAAELAPFLHGASSTAGRDRRRLRQGLVVAQVALSLGLAITAGLFVRTLHAASDIDSGFRTAGVEVVSIDTTLVNASGADAVSVVARVSDGLRTAPGVEAVGYARMIPLQGGGFGLGGVRVPGLSDRARARLEETDWDVVSPEYFRAVGLSIVRGRAFTRADRDDRPRVAIVNETLARIAWPGGSPIGQRFWQTRGPDDVGPPLEVVGIVSDAKYRTLGEPQRPFVYVPFAQHPQTQVEMFVRHSLGRSPAADLRVAIAAVEPALPIVAIQSFEAATAMGLLPQRLAAWITSSAGGIGIVLAALGLYGLVAFTVAQRSREIAIRMSLGASRRDICGMVLSQAGRLGAIGSVLGLAVAATLALVVGRLHLLVGVASFDPVAFVASTLLMAAVLLAATYLPARRAGSLDPASTLRSE